jgi:hypothetical protein
MNAHSALIEFLRLKLKRKTALFATLVAVFGSVSGSVSGSVLGAMMTAGCGKKAEEGPSSNAAASASSALDASAGVASGAGTPPPPAAPNGANNPSVDPMATMFGTMETELKNRPSIHPSVDDGFAAFAKAGVPISAPKQSLGTTYKASYCSHGLTDTKDLSVLLCEYPDEAQATAGLAESKKLFIGLKSRQTWSHKSLVMATIFQEPKLIASAITKQKKVLATFYAL